MGHVTHTAVIVTTYDLARAEEARAMAIELFEIAHLGSERLASVSPLLASGINSDWTFVVAPDGSKRGWDHRERADKQRATFIDWLSRQRWSDGSSPFEWVVVSYGSDDRDAQVNLHAWKGIRIGDNYRGPHDLDP